MLKKYTRTEIRNRILSYCAKQERCHFEVETKLKDYGASYSESQELIAYLIEHNFLNEGRYAELYVRSKFNQKGWGWHKIETGLKQKRVYSTCIGLAKKQLDPEEYRAKAESILSRKWSSIKANSIFEKRKKASQYLHQKGYEFELVQELLKGYD
jgi:regulatory protein